MTIDGVNVEEPPGFHNHKWKAKAFHYVNLTPCLPLSLFKEKGIKGKR
jgi:hypothetical protein